MYDTATLLIFYLFIYCTARIIGWLVQKWQCSIPVWSEEVSNQTREVQHTSHPQTKTQRSDTNRIQTTSKRSHPIQK